MRNRNGSYFGILIGLATGFAIGRATLTTMEELALRVYLEVDADFVDLGDVLSSRTFWKLALGAACGAAAGYVVGGRMGLPGPAPLPEPTRPAPSA